VKNNNVSDTTNSGIKVTDSSGIKFTSCQSYDDRETPLQDYGIYLYGTNTGISLLNCKLTPNELGDIYNPYSVAIVVITEKREFLLMSLRGAKRRSNLNLLQNPLTLTSSPTPNSSARAQQSMTLPILIK
jgi:hypothetical protein